MFTDNRFTQKQKQYYLLIKKSGPQRFFSGGGRQNGRKYSKEYQGIVLKKTIKLKIKVRFVLFKTTVVYFNTN